MLDISTALTLLLIVSIAFYLWDLFLLRVSHLGALLFSVVVSTAALGGIAILSLQSESFVDSNPMLGFPYERIHHGPAGIITLAVMISANWSAALLVKVYRALVLEKMTAAERSPGPAGLRAWLSPMNVISVVGLTIACMIGFDTGIGVLLVGLCLLLTIPAVNTLLQSQPTSAPPTQAPADERQRVLALVESGKISSDDAAELLTALAHSQAVDADAPAPMTGPRRIVVVGAAFVLLGFFLPWFWVDANLSERVAFERSLVDRPIDFTNSTGPAAVQITLHGGDIRSGLGWITLVAALCVAGLPTFVQQRRMPRLQQRNITFILLAIGSLAALYLLFNSFNPATTIEAGFSLALAGYALLWTGVLREHSALEQHEPAAPSPVIEPANTQAHLATGP